MDDSRLTDTDANGCEGCAHCRYAGIRWPASPDGFNDLSYVDRCDYCELYDSDEEAAKALAEHLGVRWGWALREADPKTEADIRWEPEEDDGLNYTGWSAFIDHEARDGDPAYARDMTQITLHLNPGEAQAIVEALTEYRIGMAAEWQSGELWARAVGRTLEDLRERVQDFLNERKDSR